MLGKRHLYFGSAIVESIDAVSKGQWLWMWFEEGKGVCHDTHRNVNKEQPSPMVILEPIASKDLIWIER